MNVIGDPIDERGPIDMVKRLCRSIVQRLHSSISRRKRISLSPALRLLICSTPYAKGGKIGLFGGAGVGKTVLIMELINNIAKGMAVIPCLLGLASGRVKVTTSITR